MSKIIGLIVLMVVGYSTMNAQKFITKSGKIHFFSDTPIEKIEATSKTASSVYDGATGNIEWAVLIKSFAFERALMEEHFNENYMESTKFPKAKFKGTLENNSAINLAKDGSYKTIAKGTLEMHGVSKPVTANVIFAVKGGKISASCSFNVNLADYKIDIPTMVKDKIAKSVKIDVMGDYTPYQK